MNSPEDKTEVTYWFNILSQKGIINKEGGLPLGGPVPLIKVITMMEKEGGVKIRPLLKKKGSLIVMLNGQPNPDLKGAVNPGDTVHIWQPLLGG